jgi:hypothetical protein
VSLGAIDGARGEDELVAVGDTVGLLDGPVGTNVGIAVTKSDDSDGTAVGELDDSPVGTNVGIALRKSVGSDGDAVG